MDKNETCQMTLDRLGPCLLPVHHGTLHRDARGRTWEADELSLNDPADPLREMYPPPSTTDVARAYAAAASDGSEDSMRGALQAFKFWLADERQAAVEEALR